MPTSRTHCLVVLETDSEVSAELGRLQSSGSDVTIVAQQPGEAPRAFALRIARKLSRLQHAETALARLWLCCNESLAEGWQEARVLILRTVFATHPTLPLENVSMTCKNRRSPARYLLPATWQAMAELQGPSHAVSWNRPLERVA